MDRVMCCCGHVWSFDDSVVTPDEVRRYVAWGAHRCYSWLRIQAWLSHCSRIRREIRQEPSIVHPYTNGRSRSLR